MPATSRAFALTTGTIGLVAIALLVLVVTPSRQGVPVAVSATTTVVAVPVVSADRAASSLSLSAVRRGAAPEATLSAGVFVLATPIGTGRYAVVSRHAVGTTSASNDAIEVVLPSGRMTSGHVVSASDDAVVVELDDIEPGHDVAERRPADHEVVTVMATPPITVAYADIDELADVEEGTAVIDGDGDLVGLCSESDHGTRVIQVDAGDVPGEASPDEADEP